MPYRLMFGLGALLFAVGAHAARFIPPEPSGEMVRQLQVVMTEMEQGNATEAARRLEAIYSEQPDRLIAGEAGVHLTLASWMERLGESSRHRDLVEAHERLWGSRAEAALQSCLQNPDAGVTELCAVARRYPLSVVAGRALAEAGRRAAARGDFVSAKELLASAAEKGWTASEQDEALIAALDRRVAQNPRQTAAPFLAPWHFSIDSLFAVKAFPLAGDGVTYLASSRSILAMKKTGAVLWKTTTHPEESSPPRPKKREERVRFEQAERGGIVMPAMLTGEGGARIVVARQRHADGRMQVCAFRGGDGLLLWSTGEIDPLGMFQFVSEPAVAGGYVYVQAIHLDESRLMLVALDVMTGRPLWQASLGAIEGAPTIRGRTATDPPEEFLVQTAPLVHGRYVYVTPNVGWAFCVDRFDGTVRWMTPYALPPFDAGTWRKYADQRAKGQFPKSPLPPGQTLRWSNTPRIIGQSLVLAPFDSPFLYALDPASGRVRWTQEKVSPGTLLGGLEGIVVLMGNRVQGYHPDTGEPAWSWSPDGKSRIAGPGMIVEDRLVLSLEDKIIALGADGKPARLPRGSNDFIRSIATPAGQASLKEIGLENSFSPLPPRSSSR